VAFVPCVGDLLGSASTGSCTRILAKFNLPKAKHKELFAFVQRAKGDVTD
jgi:hypothetical protein